MKKPHYDTMTAYLGTLSLFLAQWKAAAAAARPGAVWLMAEWMSSAGGRKE
jgi:hypothetical protein